MTIEQFIQKAKEGGWKYPQATHVFDVGCPRCKYCGVERMVIDRQRVVLEKEEGSGGELAEVTEKRYDMEGGPCDKSPLRYVSDAEILLDPLAWQAVGKVEGWHRGSLDEAFHPTWKQNMHRMIDALAEGKTIEDYLKTL